MSLPVTDYSKLAGDQVSVWLDPTGGICIKLHEPFNDPVELAEHEALELAELLTRLVQKQRSEGLSPAGSRLSQVSGLGQYGERAAIRPIDRDARSGAHLRLACESN